MSLILHILDTGLDEKEEIFECYRILLIFDKKMWTLQSIRRNLVIVFFEKTRYLLWKLLNGLYINYWLGILIWDLWPAHLCKCDCF